MIKFHYKHAAVCSLLFALLLIPLNSYAHEETSGVLKDTYSFQQMLPDGSTEESGYPSESEPGNNVEHCCDSQECCPDATAPPICCELRMNLSGRQLIHPNINSQIPEVYLAIFVPPEN
jgi:hypothetical protein